MLLLSLQGPKGNWWVCPDFGYDMVVCPSCEGPPMRCKSHYNLFFRCVIQQPARYTRATPVKSQQTFHSTDLLNICINVPGARLADTGAAYISLNMNVCSELQPVVWPQHLSGNTPALLHLCQPPLQVHHLHVLGVHHHDNSGLRGHQQHNTG